MSTISPIFALFTVLSGVLIFGIWSNIQAYAQQPSSSPTPLSPPTVSRSTTISPQVKAIMCAPGSPSLKVVNTTEARICGIPKTVKSNTTTAAAIPPTSTTGISSPTTTTTTTTKLSTANIAGPKQQKISTTPATSQLSKQTTGASKESPTAAPSIAPIRNVSNKPSLSSSPSTIAPQVNAVNNKHRQQEQLQPTASNVVAPDTLKYLGYQRSPTAGDSSSSGSKDKHSSDTNSSSSGHNDDDNGKSSSSSIINDISSVIKKSFNYKHSRHSDSSDVVRYFSDNSFDDNFPFTASASSSAIAGGASASASASAGSG
jgi:hypothetical protein